MAAAINRPSGSNAAATAAAVAVNSMLVAPVAFASTIMLPPKRLKLPVASSWLSTISSRVDCAFARLNLCWPSVASSICLMKPDDTSFKPICAACSFNSSVRDRPAPAACSRKASRNFSWPRVSCAVELLNWALVLPSWAALLLTCAKPALAWAVLADSVL